MSLFKRTIDLTRFRTETPVRSDQEWLLSIPERLGQFAFREQSGALKEVNQGWVRADDIASVDFGDPNSWSIDDLLFFGFRIEKRRIPRNLFNAELKKRLEAWAKEREISRVPAAVRQEIKEELEDAWCRRSLPTAKHLQIVIETGEGEWGTGSSVRIFGGAAESEMDSIRRQFYRTFGLKIVPLDTEPVLEYGRLLEVVHQMGAPLRLERKT